MLTYREEGLSEDRLKELNDSRAVLEAIGELSEKGWKNRVMDFRGGMRYGYWLMGTREKIEEGGEEKDTALEVISLVAGVIILIKDKLPNMLYSLEFIQDGEYVVEKIFQRGKERLEEVGITVPVTINTIATSMANRGSSKVEEYFEKTIRIYDEFLERELIGQRELYEARGIALRELADLHLGFGRLLQAEVTYLNSLASFDKAIELDKRNPSAYLNKATSLSAIASYYSGQENFSKAKEYFEKAILIYRALLNSNRQEDAHIYNNLGITIRNLVDLYIKTKKQEEAEKKVIEAISCFNAAINIINNVFTFHQNKANCLVTFGDIYFSTGRFKKAEEKYKLAIISYNTALKINPKYTKAYGNLGICLSMLAMIYKNDNNYITSIEKYKESTSSFANAIELNSTYADFYYYKGNCHWELAKLYTYSTRLDYADHNYRSAINLLAKAIELTRGKIARYVQLKEIIQKDYSQFLFQMERKGESAQIDQFIHAMYRQGKLEEENGNRERAMSLYKRVIATIIEGYREREAMNLNRHFILILCHKRLGKIMTQLGKGKEEIREEYENALNLIETALEMELDESTKKALENEKREIEKLMNDLDS